MFMYRVFSCVVGRGCLLWPVSSLDKTVLTFGLLHFPKGWDGRVERHMLIFSWENSKITTHCWTFVDRRMLDPTKKRAHVHGQRRSPNKMVGGAKSHLESNPIPTRDTQRAQTKPTVHSRRTHRDWARPDFECLCVSCESMGQQFPASLFHIWTILINDAVKILILNIWGILCTHL